MRAYSTDLRRKVVQAYKAGQGSQRSLAQLFGVSLSFVQELRQRDENLRVIRRAGHKRWKKEAGYRRRSLAETAIFRLKTIFGATLRSRNFAQQATELFLRATALNRMTQLGMPESYQLAV